MRHPRHYAADGNLQTARLLLLWIVGKPADPHYPDAVAAMLTAEAQAVTPSPPMPADREARERLAVMELAQEIRACWGLIPAPGDAGEPTLEDLD